MTSRLTPVLSRGTPAEQKQSGLKRTDTVEKLGFRAMQLARRQPLPILVMTSDIPARKMKAGLYLASLSDDVWDVIGYRGDLRGFRRLQGHLSGPLDALLPDAPWRRPLESAAPQLFREDDELTDTAHSCLSGQRRSRP